MAERFYEGKNRKERLAQVKKGPGVFVYDGSSVDHEWTPTIRKTSGKEPIIGDDGSVELDGAGRPLYRPVGMPVYDSNGYPMFGGLPEKKVSKISVYKIRGMEFPEGVPVKVDSPSLALKLRCHAGFEEVEDKPKRGRPPKSQEGDAA